MEILAKEQHRALAFIAACTNNGYTPTAKDVEAWLKQPLPRGASYEYDSAFARVLSGFSLAEGILGRSRLVTPSQGMVDHLIQLGWVRSTQSALRLSELGHALLAAAERQAIPRPDIDVVVLGRDDPLSYAQLIGRLAKASGGMLVDPYVRLKQLHDVVVYTDLARVLTSDKIGPGDVSAIGVYLASPDIPRPIDVRVTGDSAVHDRMLIANGEVHTIGASVNAVASGVTTVLTPMPPDAANALVEAAEGWWLQARPLPEPVVPAEATAPKRRTKPARGTAQK